MEAIIKKLFESVVNDIMQHKIDCVRLDEHYYTLGMLYAFMDANRRDSYSHYLMNSSGIIAYPRPNTTSNIQFTYSAGHISKNDIFVFKSDRIHETREALENFLCRLISECIELELEYMNRQNSLVMAKTKRYNLPTDIELDDIVEERVEAGSIYAQDSSWVYTAEYAEKLRTDHKNSERGKYYAWSEDERQLARKRDIAARKGMKAQR